MATLFPRVFGSCIVFEDYICSNSRGRQHGPESATNEGTLESLLKHGLINRVYLPFVTSSNILAVHWLYLFYWSRFAFA